MLIKNFSENRNERPYLKNPCFDRSILSISVISCIVDCYSVNTGNVSFCSSHELRTVPILRIEMYLYILKPGFRQTNQIGKKSRIVVYNWNIT